MQVLNVMGAGSAIQGGDSLRQLSEQLGLNRAHVAEQNAVMEQQGAAAGAWPSMVAAAMRQVVQQPSRSLSSSSLSKGCRDLLVSGARRGGASYIAHVRMPI